MSDTARDPAPEDVARADMLADLRTRGEVSAAVADLVEDPALGQRETERQIAVACAEAVAAAAKAVPDLRVTVARKDAVVSDVHVDEWGAVVYTVTHPDLPAVYPSGPEAGVAVNPFRAVNPPVAVRRGTTRLAQVVERGVDGPVLMERTVEVPDEDPEAAFREVIVQQVREALRRCGVRER